jgi:ATP-binding cassette subfamily C protein LapB
MGQDAGIFSGTFRENLTFGDESITDDKIVHAMEVTGFSSVIQKFPNGLSFVISENGQELSGGQKQILSLTRSVLLDPTFVIYDEPTSAMDPRHENLFVKKMSSFLEKKTFIVVTHRRPILALTERLIVIENGAIILDGKRDDVLAKFR